MKYFALGLVASNRRHWKILFPVPPLHKFADLGLLMILLVTLQKEFGKKMCCTRENPFMNLQILGVVSENSPPLISDVNKKTIVKSPEEQNDLTTGKSEN